MLPQETEDKYKPGWEWLGRSLDNYKKMHRRTAESKGIDISSAKTLTEARKLLFGYKKGNVK